MSRAGVLSSTSLTLVIVPVIYAMLEQFKLRVQASRLVQPGLQPSE